jgi:hypothetical protein
MMGNKSSSYVDCSIQDTQYDKDPFKFYEQAAAGLLASDKPGIFPPPHLNKNSKKKRRNLSVIFSKSENIETHNSRASHKNILELFKHKFTSKLSITQQNKTCYEINSQSLALRDNFHTKCLLQVVQYTCMTHKNIAEVLFGYV